VPNITLGPVRTGPVTRLGDISSDTLGEHVVLKVSDTLGGKTGPDEEQETGRDNKEPVEGTGRSSAVDDITDDTTREQTGDNGNGNRRGLDVE